MRYLSLIFFSLSQVVFAQRYEVAIGSGLKLLARDFYLNYKAIENSQLKNSYGNGSNNSLVEQYEFYPQWSFVPKISIVTKNPRNPNTQLLYSIGLGYSRTSFEITPADRIYYITDSIVLSSGLGRIQRYELGYLIIPLEVKKRFFNMRKSAFVSMGLELSNYFLISNNAFVKYEGEKEFSEFSDPRISAARTYLLMLSVKPEVGVKLFEGLRMSLSLDLGVTPTNLLRYDEQLFELENLTYKFEGINAYEKTSAINLFYGLNLHLAYQF